ncbi:hypothetical protein [Paenibacillus mucilaginosus]|uniref:Uncharacterized protein n=2 Tax=Paenibacillus mucilaginosus TaxID=61624 RepID=H6NK95_9BACL|nr:hypothetical protein [Paenibacillus mucilaginosus]AEI43998.1 hypothetical protein KNP414_05474 [Paenibacillus mucilaginosus KNP414]AFC31579.1 hypothetical protein PM3016_4843 [Paenibacillus mucilaginosus 3016]MCG7212512.1 hypothetical protein [Paenibacillus mucilaginosus]WDM25456.1 hypothetical protein KCX80_23745 [Paenibacillus mucilaginosus]WFA20117.1 hypothetical protein ERY13_24200 [Paenibacillus mucilaginosus]
MNTAYEMYDDPFKMLILLATLAAEQRGEKLDFNKVGEFENETFRLQHELFHYKKEDIRITWHEFLGRDIACSRDLSRQEYNKMFVDCMASLYGIG